jgi:cysteine desulfurase family protein
MKLKNIVYFDNAATTFPKPEGFYRAFNEFYKKKGGNPGRSGHSLSIAAGEALEEAREMLGKLLGASDPFRIIFTYNASYALNLALRGILKEGDFVLTSSLEHNSVARPLRTMQKAGMIDFEIIPINPKTGIIELEALEASLRKRKVKLVTIVHGSNVAGTIQPIKEIASLAHHYGAFLLVDAAQTAGTYPINVERDEIDLLAFTGHKGLFGPQGIGGLYVRPGFDLEIFFSGGTGSKSEEDLQPEFMPDRLEIGTPNAGGAASLAAGISFVLQKGVDNIHLYEKNLANKLIAGLENLPKVKIVAREASERLPVVSFTIEGMSVSEVGYRLDAEYGICTRVGLHCAPWAHRSFGTFPEGTVRASLSVFNTEEEVDYFIKALEQIVSG